MHLSDKTTPLSRGEVHWRSFGKPGEHGRARDSSHCGEKQDLVDVSEKGLGNNRELALR